jgi:hypothetical protein
MPSGWLALWARPMTKIDGVVIAFIAVCVVVLWQFN